jgi:hypothetical protein
LTGSVGLSGPVKGAGCSGLAGLIGLDEALIGLMLVFWPALGLGLIVLTLDREIEADFDGARGGRGGGGEADEGLWILDSSRGGRVGFMLGVRDPLTLDLEILVTVYLFKWKPWIQLFCSKSGMW